MVIIGTGLLTAGTVRGAAVHNVPIPLCVPVGLGSNFHLKDKRAVEKNIFSWFVLKVLAAWSYEHSTISRLISRTSWRKREQHKL